MVNGVIIKKIDLVNSIIILVKFIKAFGKIIKNLAMVKCIIVNKYIIKVNGKIIKKMVMEFIMIMVIYLKDNLLIIKKKVLDI